MQVDGIRVLVTGGTSGIGRAIVDALATAHARVLTCGTNPERVAASRLRPGVVHALECDLTEAEDVRALTAAVETHLGGLDVLINCAGVQDEGDVMAGLDMRSVEREIAVNLTAPIRLTSALLPLLARSDRAAVVNVTSILALSPKAAAPVYCASKAALASWTTSLRYQLAPRGIRVMELVPPVVATPMTAGRQEGAIAPGVVARACLEGLRHDRQTIRVGTARPAWVLHRLAPATLARKLRTA